MKYALAYSTAYRKSIKRIVHQGEVSMEKLHEIVNLLASGARLPDSARDHKLQGNLNSLRQCHIKGDLLLQYHKNERLCVITLVDIGTHHDLLGR